MTQKKPIQVRLKPTTIEQLKKISSNKEETVSEYVRKLLENHLINR